MQARAEALQAQVRDAVAQLRRLQESQSQLEARNALLEAAAVLNVARTTLPSAVRLSA